MQKATDYSVNSAVKPAGDGLGRCLVDGDATLASSERRRRGKAFGLSLLMETAALAVLVIAPLVTSVAKPVFTQPVFTRVAFGGHLRTTSPHNPTGTPHRAGNFRVEYFSPIPGHVPARPVQEDSGSGDFINDGGPDLGQRGFVPLPFVSTGVVEPPPAMESGKASMNRPLKVSSSIIEAQLISRVEPRYPQIAVISKREGAVILHAIISRDGRINFLEVVSGPPLLAEAALDAVRQWRYRPTLLNGEPVEVETTITVNFRLHAE